MNIKFVGQYKALNSFEWSNIPSLAILTGLNGTGKSQLLQVLTQAYLSLSYNYKQHLSNSYDGQTYKVTLDEIDFVKNGLINWQSQGGNFSFEQQKFGFRDLEKICEHILNFIKPNPDPLYLFEQQQFENYRRQNNATNYEDPYPGYSRLKGFIEEKKDKLLNAIIERSGKPKDNLLPEDILFYLPEDILSDGTDLLNQDNIDILFFLYLYRTISLRRRGNDTSILGDAPWDILNKVIKSAGLPYALTIPNEEPIEAIFNDPLNRLSPYQFAAKLIDPVSGIDIGIYSLSSGEKIILSLALLLYYFQHRNLKKTVIVLDEIDAHLHPSLTKQFFDVIYNVVIKEYGANVIMATHSPSTVALAPVADLYIIKKGINTTIIETVDKDKALSILTSGVPSLSINYENRRQVFVESKYDVEYYDAIYSQIKDKLIQGISINFISSGVSGRGNCQQVMEIVKKLNDFGNKSIYGIIDWDSKNVGDKNIKVLGETLRYSIESYIFDPGLMCYYLLKFNLIEKQALGMNESDRYTSYAEFSQEKIQIMVSKLINLVKPNFKDVSDSTLEHIHYINGFIIEIPNWFLKTSGHQLPNIFLKVFPKLNQHKDENSLRKHVIENTTIDMPEFISTDLLFLFASIQDLNDVIEEVLDNPE